jgi:ankyrin repeat protein
MTPLHEAAKIGYLPIFELIIENHEDINCRDGYGWTPLYWAEESGHLEICQLIFPLVKEKNPVWKNCF